MAAALTTVAAQAVAQPAEEPVLPDGFDGAPTFPAPLPPIVPDPLRPLTPAEFFDADPNADLHPGEYFEYDYDGDGWQDIVVVTVGVGLDEPARGGVTVHSGWRGGELFTIVGPAFDDFFGFSTSGIGDLDGDGLSDLLVSAPADDANGQDTGAVYLYSGVDGTLLTTFRGTIGDAGFGHTVTPINDVDGDGKDEIAVSAPFDGPGAVHLFLSTSLTMPDGSLAAARVASDADRVWHGSVINEMFGFALADVGDVSGDGVHDLAIGAPGHNPGGLSAAGQVALVSGLDGTGLGSVTGVTSTGLLGYSVTSAGERGADGRSDVLLGAPGDPEAQNAGRAYLFTSSQLGQGAGLTRSASEAAVTLSADALPGADLSDVVFGFHVVRGNDVNRDGVRELLVHSSVRDANGEASLTRAFVFSGADASFLYAFTGAEAAPLPPGGDRDGEPNQLEVVVSNYGKEGATVEDGDLNLNTKVDAPDLIIAIENTYGGSAEAQQGPPLPLDSPLNCLGILRFDFEEGTFVCDESGGFSPPFGPYPGPDFGGAGDVDAWCAQCEGQQIPDAPLTEIDCAVTVFCELVSQTCATARDIASSIRAKNLTLTNDKAAAETARNAALAGGNVAANQQAVQRAQQRFNRRKSNATIWGVAFGGGVEVVSVVAKKVISGPPGWIAFGVGTAGALLTGAVSRQQAIEAARLEFRLDVEAANQQFPVEAETIQTAYESAIQAANDQHAAACRTINIRVVEWKFDFIQTFAFRRDLCLGNLP